MFKINPWKLERMKRNFNESFSFTYLFLAIQAALFIVMTLAGGSTMDKCLLISGRSSIRISFINMNIIDS